MKKVWVALILLAVIAGIVFLVLYMNEQQPMSEDRTLYDYKDNSVEEIYIVSGTDEVLFVKEQNMWAMMKPKPYEIDPDAVNRLENRLKDFLASRILEGEQDLSKYGLDKPAAAISFRLNDGTENTLYIGDITASKVQYYAKDAADDRIFILGSYDVENFLCPLSEFRERSILTVDPEAINAIAMDNLEARDFKIVQVDSGAWRITEPLEMDARGDAVEEMLGDVVELKIKDFVAEEPENLSEYGLDSPTYTLEITDSKQNTQKIYFGTIDEDEQIVYMRLDGSHEVYTLSLEVFDPRRFSISNFLDEAPLSISISDVNKVSINANGALTVFERDASKAEDTFTYNGKEINMEYFTALYVNIMALTAEGYDPGNNGGTPELTVILECGNNEMIKAEFVRRDDLSYFFVLNSQARPFYIGERKVDLIKRWTDRVLEDM